MSRPSQVAPNPLDAPTDNPVGPFSHQGVGCDLKGALNGKRRTGQFMCSKTGQFYLLPTGEIMDKKDTRVSGERYNYV